jgi:hypothetical protein
MSLSAATADPSFIARISSFDSVQDREPAER